MALLQLFLQEVSVEQFQSNSLIQNYSSETVRVKPLSYFG